MKNNLRKIAKEKRKQIFCSAFDLKIKQNLFDLEEYKKAKNIMCYYSFGSEVSTLEFFSDKTKNWYLPRIDCDDLLVCPYIENEFLENKYKILEPKTIPIVDLSIVDMVIIPALCADKNGYRVGYGKGYYDRFLKKLSKSCKKVILVYSDLLFDTVYPEFHDEKADYIVTELNILNLNVKKQL